MFADRQTDRRTDGQTAGLQTPGCRFSDHSAAAAVRSGAEVPSVASLRGVADAPTGRRHLVQTQPLPSNRFSARFV